MKAFRAFCRKEYIEDPEEYLKKRFPGKEYIKTDERSIPDDKVPPYIIMERNGCVVNAAASMLQYSLKPHISRSEALNTCRGIAERLNIKTRKNGYYVPLGRTSQFLGCCAKELGSCGRAKSSLFAKSTAIREINAGRPVFINIAVSRQYYDHTVIAYGWEIYRPSGRGRKILFFKIRDGYSKAPRYLICRRIFGVFTTIFVI
ncbi:MAG: hypothetical protein IJM39_06550 [Firmicutes bacterium]|nr:hypothetical protein [Bacillota bacterium]